MVAIGILSTHHSPLLPHLYEKLTEYEDIEIILLYDTKESSKRDERIWKTRTSGFFDLDNARNRKIKSAWNSRTSAEYIFASHNEIKTSEKIRDLKLQGILNGGTPRILKRPILDSTPWGVLNVHPGLLPHFRGCSCVEWALWNGSPIGNTLHKMNENIDAGPVLAQQACIFTRDETYTQIRIQVYLDGIRLASKTLRELVDGKLGVSDYVEQDEKDAKYWSPIPDSIFSQIVQKPWHHY